MNYFDNKAIVDKTFNGKAFGSNAVALPGDAYVNLDIVHSLGADTKQTATLGIDWVDNGSDSYTATTATSALSNLSDNTTDNVQVNFTISNWTEGDVEGYGTDGTYTVDVTNDSLKATGFSGDVLINSVKEITTNNSYFTYTDPVTQDIETIASRDNASASSKELIANGDSSFSSTANIHEIILSDTLVNGMYFSHQELDGDIKGFSAFYKKPIEKINGTATGAYYDYHYTPGIHEYIIDGDVVKLQFYPQSIGNVFSGTNISVKQVLPVSTKYRMTNDFSNAVSHDIPFSQADLDLMSTDPLTLMRVFFDGLVLPSGFAKVNIKNIYCGNEGLRGGSIVYDLVNP